ncbi:MAG: DtxR family iron (metal) dependent repressor [Candidatus Terraquivivens tikiterensis]|uniref:DtxR family iron (Metal) dependent repressor n=1 Tax=Candidatus Terraquivivens tikiterensis TaxID=1980982 RepID=A0A2R7Y1H1_9ARCH|nr:MAG: DtxR family iron (metal) dependent repressor [Candidatus Terraquivivens tikiterensis]
MNKYVSRKVEDYLKAVYEVVGNKGYARIKDISKVLGVKPSTVVEMMRKLSEQGLVIYEKYSGVTLTSSGREIAEAVKKRHDTFRRFLEIILVPENIAVKDAHVLEHQLDPKTILQFTRFVEFITQASATERPKFIKRWIEEFRNYCRRKDITL